MSTNIQRERDTWWRGEKRDENLNPKYKKVNPKYKQEYAESQYAESQQLL